LLEAGDADGVVETLFRELVRMPPADLAMMRAQRDAWAARLRNAVTLPRELRADAGYVFRAERYADVRSRALLLVGGDSPAIELESAEAVAAALPHAEVRRMHGQQHAAMYASPELFVQTVVDFLKAR
jgi:pimeloyl-ACP methyl ester carboxylesterase